MALDDEKKEREKIKKKIKEKKEKRDNIKEKKRNLETKNKELNEKMEVAKNNIKCFENKEKYIKIMDAVKLAQVELDKALQNLEASYSSYKKNFQGNAAKVINPKFNGSRNDIIKIKNDSTGIWNAASAGKSACENMIKSNNSKIGKVTNNVADCNRFIKECVTTISDNRRIIGDYNNRIHDLEKEINRLERKL